MVGQLSADSQGSPGGDSWGPQVTRILSHLFDLIVLASLY